MAGIVLTGILLGLAGPCQAQDAQPATNGSTDDTTLQQEVNDLRAIVTKLQARVDELEKKSVAAVTASAAVGTPAVTEANGAPAAQSSNTPVQQPATPEPAPHTEAANATPPITNVVAPGTTINFFLDAYYAYNFNQPIGRVNELRAYDVSSNAFSINQAGVIFENQADPDHGKRYGVRLDFQYGQATQATQGNAANEPRPEIYRNIFQAYGTYVAPVGQGLTIDVGKFASSLGYEGNYTKDQINYSRSFWFNFLPFYHLGLRANYKFNDVFAVNYWMVNGTNQSEPFNGFKDEFIGLALTPNKNVSWNIQYYLGQEHPDVMFFPNGGAPANAPTLQGVPFEPVTNSPGGKLHIFDTYLSWQATPKWTFAIEADDEVSRLYSYSSPQYTDGGAIYLKYQVTPKFFVGGRGEYLSDRGGLFTGQTQAVKENTLTLAYRFADGFQVMGEWRRDFSNRPYFYTNLLGILKGQQNTATMGFLWWFGGKQGSW
ncbi:MAG: outer membrane beta-barrel protein [Acidobacteriaceae bacterium]|nr:outer membrane beta-barrel protein [Acidobacteriaceae bacterium]